MGDFLTAGDAISGDRLSFQEANALKNHYYGASEPVNAVAGVIWVDSGDDRAYVYDGVDWNLIPPLDEVGIWTPSLTFGGNNVNMTYLADGQDGRYVRIGDWVSITGRIRLTDKGDSVGSALIEDLPFTCKDDPGSYAVAGVRLSVITFADQWTAFIVNNTDYITLREQVAATGAFNDLDNTNFSDTSLIMISATYEIDT